MKLTTNIHSGSDKLKKVSRSWVKVKVEVTGNPLTASLFKVFTARRMLVRY